MLAVFLPGLRTTADSEQFPAINSNVDGSINVRGRFTEGPSPDGKGQFKVVQNRLMGQEPVLTTGPKEAHAQKEQMAGILSKVKDAIFG